MRPVGCPRETILRRVLAEKLIFFFVKICGFLRFHVVKGSSRSNTLTSLSDLGGGAVQLTILRINEKNSTENMLRACKNFMFCVLEKN